MRVLHVIDSLARGGAEHALVDLVAGQRAIGVDAHVAALGGAETLASELRSLGAHVELLRGERRWDPLVAARLAGVARGFDVVHAHLFMSEFYVGLVPGVRRVVTLHNLGYDEDPAVTAAQRLRRAFHRRVLGPRVAAWIAVSEAAAASYSHHLSLEGVDVVPNAFELPPDAPGDSFHAEAFRAENDVRARSLVVSVGRLTVQKGHDVLLDAVAGLPPDEVEVVIVGDGPLRDRLADRAAALSPRIRFIGARPRREVLGWMAAADVFALPSLHEAFGVVVLEAMALGRAVVATRAGGVPGLVREDVDALLVAPGSPSALRTSLERVLSDRSLREELGRAARESVRTRFDRANTARAVAAVYERVTRRGATTDA